jgi:HAD superfamily hydrolase (TIGR01509 family)
MMSQSNISTQWDPPADARALLFDCDGTLVDTMGLYKHIWTEIFAEFDFELTDEWWHNTGNVAIEPFVRAALPDADDELIERLRLDSLVRFERDQHLLTPLEHVVDVVRRYHGVIPMAVCSGSYRSSVVGALKAVGIAELFDEIITADDVTESKPAPDIYLLGMQRLGVQAHEVAVYEDSAIGMAAAVAAGVESIIDVRDQ